MKSSVPHSAGHAGLPSSLLQLLRLATLALALLPGLPATAQAPAPAVVSAQMQYSLAAEAATMRDYPSMVQLLRASAEGGYLPAQELLGVVLLNGPSLYGLAVPRDFCGAFKWLARAAAQGSAVGRLHVTLMHRARRDRVRECH